MSHLLVWSLTSILAAPAPEATARTPPLEGVRRIERISIPLTAAKTKREPVLRPLPGDRGFELDADVGIDEARGFVGSLPPNYHTSLREIEHGIRLRIAHPDGPLRVASATFSGRSREYVVAFGGEAEQARIRRLSEHARRPLPAPSDLGPHLELWNDATQATQRGDLVLAKRLWEKLLVVPGLRDLAALRISQLFVISGHVEEALDRLHTVSREHPRSAGASLARLTALRIEAIISDTKPTVEQTIVAASSVSRHRFREFAWLSACEVFAELGAYDKALEHLPPLDGLPKLWQDEARVLRHGLISSALGRAVANDDALGTASTFLAWHDGLDAHPQRDLLEALAAESFSALGLFDRAIPILGDRLRRLPKSVEEADIVSQLTDALAATGQLAPHLEVVEFQFQQHPQAPGLPEQLRSLALTACDNLGLAATRAILRQLRGMTREPRLLAASFATEIDLLEAHGTSDELLLPLEALSRLGFDDPPRRERRWAIALARAGRAAEAAPRLRQWIGRVDDPEARDELAYLLADAEITLGRDQEATRILRALAQHGTRWGQVAKARLQERTLQYVVTFLEQRNEGASAPQVAPSLARGGP